MYIPKDRNLKLSEIIATTLFFIELFLLVCGLLLVVKPVYHFVRREVIRFQAHCRWDKCLSTKNYCCRSGSPVAWLKIPASKTDTLVLLGTNRENLLKFPSLNENFALPEKNKLKLIMAHRDIHFREFGKLKDGNEVTIQARDSRIKRYFVVETEIVRPEKVVKCILEKRNEDYLVLMTCYPFRYIGHAPKRFLVWCKLIAEEHPRTFLINKPFYLHSHFHISHKLLKHFKVFSCSDRIITYNKNIPFNQNIKERRKRHV